MSSKINIDKESKIAVYKQLVRQIQDLVRVNTYKTGDFIPSMNDLAMELNISKETVKKAYSILREKGIIESAHGKGFYVTNSMENKIRILLLFDNINTYKHILYNSFLESLDNNAEITIRLHNQDFEVFNEFVEENLGYFDYYIITPHFPLDSAIQKKVIKTLKKIPNRKLILLDRNIKGLPGNYGAVYQDFENDVCEGLSQGLETLKKFKVLNMLSMPGSLYAPLAEKSVQTFCNEHNISFKNHKTITMDAIKKHEAYLIFNSQLDVELLELAKAAKQNGYEIGKDIGVISYNESPINEIVLNGLTVLSTDFKKMGELAAKMVLEKTLRKIKCDFHLIKRSTF